RERHGSATREARRASHTAGDAGRGARHGPGARARFRDREGEGVGHDHTNAGRGRGIAGRIPGDGLERMGPVGDRRGVPGNGVGGDGVFGAEVGTIEFELHAHHTHVVSGRGRDGDGARACGAGGGRTQGDGGGGGAVGGGDETADVTRGRDDGGELESAGGQVRGVVLEPEVIEV